MDFLDPDKKKAHSQRLVIGYVLMAIALAFGSMIVLFRTFGYDLDRKTGRVIQNGLVYVSAKPQSANTFVNGVDKGSTDTRLTIPSGRYRVQLKRDGYRDWQKTIILEGGSVEQLVYPRLFPKKLDRTDIQLYAKKPVFATSSLNRRWLLVAQPGSVTRFDLFDLDNADQNPETITLPGSLLTKSSGGHQLSLVEWSDDNRRVLVKHAYKGGHEFIIIDRQTPASSINLNKTLSTKPSKITLRDKKHDSYYIFNQTKKQLQTATLEARNPSVLLNGVIAYKTFDEDTILYITKSGAPAGKVAVKIQDGRDRYTLRSLPAKTSYLLDLAKFNGKWLIVAGAKNENQTYIYKDPFPILKRGEPSLLPPAIALKLSAPLFVSFSGNSRFVAVQRGQNFAVYDAETDRRHYFKLGVSLMSAQQAYWMDGHHLYVVYKNKTLVFDFDGINKQILSAAQPELQVFFNRNYEELYTIAPSVEVSGRFALTRTELKVGN